MAGAVILALATAASSCGGGGNGGAGGPLVLIRCSVDSIDNVALNQSLVLLFDREVDPASVGTGSIQIREGPSFGRTVEGGFRVEGAEVRFLPALPTSCDLDATGHESLRPGTGYRITVVGRPEEFSVRALDSDEPLERTLSFGFQTRVESDPQLFEDMVPAARPEILQVSHADGDAAVAVNDRNEFRVSLTEALAPCSVSSQTVRIHVYEWGDPETRLATAEGRLSGFSPVEDNSPDPHSWGSTASTVRFAAPQRVPSSIALHQDYESTEILIRPAGGRFPENALVVVELTGGITDLAGSPLAHRTFAFTTENLPPQEREWVIDFEGETPILEHATTADVDTGRSPGRAQGWFTFTGDGDNGARIEEPAGPLGCLGQENDFVPDDFDPKGQVVFDTGASRNTCANAVDGSRAVVWEFRSFHLRSDLILRFVGVNPAIVLVRGDVLIEQGATVLVRGSRTGDVSPVADGERFQWANQGAPLPVTARGGEGVAGGGDGGDSVCASYPYGYDGVAGFGSPDEGVRGGHGTGLGGVALQKPDDPTNGGCAGGGGGGGHGHDGEDGLSDPSPYAVFMGPPRSDGGVRYWAGSSSVRMLQPSAGSGGGGGGWLDHFTSGSGNGPSGGGGGAGGGYLAIACGGDLVVSGTIDASGGTGGRAVGIWRNKQYLARGGGGGGGAGGGILLTTPGQIVLSASTVITAAGGARGLTGTAQPPPPYNHGGNGANGRIVLEDADGILPGGASALLVPGEGSVGFYRGTFDESRFVEGRVSQALTSPFYVGGFEPSYQAADARDFIARVPWEGSPPPGATAILVEARGYPLLPDGGPDVTASSPWYTAGHFETAFDPDAPLWRSGAEPIDRPRPPDNAGPDLTMLNVPGGLPYLQVRITFFLGDAAGASDPGALLDRWSVRFREDH